MQKMAQRPILVQRGEPGSYVQASSMTELGLKATPYRQNLVQMQNLVMRQSGGRAVNYAYALFRHAEHGSEAVLGSEENPVHS